MLLTSGATNVPTRRGVRVSEIGISFRGIPTVKKVFPGDPYHARLDVPRPAVWCVTRLGGVVSTRRPIPILNTK